jgi:hypothetical protein
MDTKAGDESLGALFRGQAREVLGRHPEVPHTWSSDACELHFPRADESGFDVIVDIGEEELTVHAHGAHQHFPARDGTAREEAEAALGLVRDLLSPDMRLRERLASGKPYLWMLEANRGLGWKKENLTGLMIFKYFGRRAERTYQNRWLPGRLRSPGAAEGGEGSTQAPREEK